MAENVIQGWLTDHVAKAPLVAAGAVVQWAAGAGQWKAAVSPSNTEAAQPLLAAAKAAGERGEPLLARCRMGKSTTEQRVVASALRHEGVTVGAIALLLNDDAASDAELISHVQRAAASVESLLAPASAVLGDLLRLQTFLTHSAGLASCAVSLVSELASLLRADRVSLGLMAGRELQLIALSHSADNGDRSTAINAPLRAAMREAIDLGQPLAYPQPTAEAPRIVQAHAALASLGAGHVLTVPLVHEGRSLGALCFEGQALAAASRRATELACGLAPLIQLKSRAELSWAARARARTNEVTSGIVRGRRAPGVLWASAAVAGVAALTLVPIEHRVGAPARLEGAVQRSVAAPVDGYVQSVRVRPGDIVKAGDLLAQMAPQELQLEERKWVAEATQHDNSAAAALAIADRAQFAVAQAKSDEARAQLELVRGQLSRSRLVAPIDGVVIGGDLTQSLGAPVQRGQVLMTLAPQNSYRLIVEVDERDVAKLSVGQPGQLALAALPAQRFDFQVVRITPVAITSDGRNAFEVEGRLADGPAAMRPGLRGVAKVSTGTRSLLRALVQPGLDWLRLAFWRWSW